MTEKEDKQRKEFEAEIDSIDLQRGLVTFYAPDRRWTAGKYIIIPISTYQAAAQSRDELIGKLVAAAENEGHSADNGDSACFICIALAEAAAQGYGE